MLSNTQISDCCGRSEEATSKYLVFTRRILDCSASQPSVLREGTPGRSAPVQSNGLESRQPGPGIRRLGPPPRKLADGLFRQWAPSVKFLCERRMGPDNQKFISVPLTAFIFGQSVLPTSPFRWKTKQT